VPGGQDEELVGRLIEEGREAGHGIIPQMQVVDQTTKQLGNDHDVFLERREPGDVEAASGCVAGPHPESSVAGLPGHRSELVTQIGKQSPIVSRVGEPLLDEVTVRGGSQRVDINEERRPISLRWSTAPNEADAAVQIGRAGEDVAGNCTGGAGCNRFILSANNIAEAQPVEQLGRGGVRQVRRLMRSGGSVVGFQCVDRIQSELRGPAGIAFDSGAP